MRGVVQRRGPRSLSVVGAAAWNLAELVELRREGGLDAVAPRLAEPVDTGSAPDDAASDGGRRGDTGRRIRMSTGYRMHPWADLRPAGDEPSQGPSQVRKLWHQSPGSAG